MRKRHKLPFRSHKLPLLPETIQAMVIRCLFAGELIEKPIDKLIYEAVCKPDYPSANYIFRQFVCEAVKLPDNEPTDRLNGRQTRRLIGKLTDRPVYKLIGLSTY